MYVALARKRLLLEDRFGGLMDDGQANKLCNLLQNTGVTRSKCVVSIPNRILIFLSKQVLGCSCLI